MSFRVLFQSVFGLRQLLPFALAFSLLIPAAILMQTQNASATFTCTSHPIIPPDGIDNAIGAITATEADPACFGLGAWVSPSSYDSMPTAFSARDAIQVLLPDADRPASSFYRAKIQAESGTGFSTVSATCSTATAIYGNNTTVAEVELADGSSCTLTATATLTGEVVTYQATLARVGDKYTLSNGIASGGNFDRPEISLGSTETSFIPDAGTDSWSNAVAGVAKTVTYTISNFGYADLILTGSGATHVASSNVLSASYSHYSATTISQGAGTATFDVTLTPIAVGAFTQSFTVISNDVDEATFDITISGTAVAPPELDIRNNVDNADITDGSTTISSALGTDFGNVGVGSNASNTFRAENNGTATLTFDADALSISNTTDFSITSDLTNSGTVASSGVETFTIQFNPASSGTKTATVTIRSDDANEDPYTFQIQGVGAVPTFSKAFSPTTIPPGGTSLLTFTITNGSDIIANNLDFTDNLPAGVTVASSPNGFTSCPGGVLTATAGASLGSFTGGQLSAGGTCMVQFNVTSSTAGTANNVSGNLTSSLGNSGTAAASLTVAAAPTFAKAFGTTEIPSGGTSTLTFTINNGTAISATSLRFTDTFPANMTVASTPNVSSDCGGTFTATGGAGSVSLSGGTVGAIASCTIYVDVTATATGTNPAVTLSSSNGNANSASATLTVTTPEISVSSSEGGSVADAGTDAHGSERVDTSKVVTYTITNSGTAALNLTNSAPTLSSATNVGTPTVGNYSSTTVSSGGGTATFTVTYTPAATGAFSYDLDIISDDADEANYDIAAAGTGVEPNLDVLNQGFSATIANGDLAGDATTGKGTDFGSTVIGINISRTFVAFNSGSSNLNFGSDALAISDTTNFTITTDLTNSGSIASGSNNTFTIQFNPTSFGTKTTTVTIRSDDPDADPYTFVITALATGPEIGISSSEGGAVADGGTDAHGSETVAAAKIVTYTITNSGTETLNLTNAAPTLSGATNVGTPTVGNYTSTTVASGGGTATFTITYIPAAAGAFSYDIDIISDDADEANYDIAVSGTAVVPEIAISSSEGGSVADAGTDAHGSEPAGTPKVVTYTITNSGAGTLTLTNTAATLSGASNAGTPTVGNYSTTTVAAAGGTATFTVTYTPSVAGPYSFDIDVISDDADEATYDIAVSGTATGSPEIAISSSEGGAVADGGTDAHGSEPAGVAKVVTYTITNTGLDSLNFTGAAPTLTGATNVGTPAVGNYSSSNVAPSGGTATFTITYTPGIAGSFSFELDVISDDTDEANYDIAVSGTATGSPEISISSSESGAVADGGTDAHGSVPAASAKIVTYTITNTGTDTLNLTNSAPSASGGVNVGMPTIGNYSSTALAPLTGTATFTVTYTPAVAGAFSFNLDIISDDTDEATYNIAISGTATGTPEISILSSESGAVADGGTDAQGSEPAGTAKLITFTVTNTGTDTLTFTGSFPNPSNQININGIFVNGYSSATVAPGGGTATFTVTYTPNIAGAFSFDIDVISDDADEGNYDITISGTATGAPEIAISSSESGAVADGGTDAQGSEPAATPKTLTYTITNTGTDTLNLTNAAPSLTGATNAGTPTVGNYASTSVAPSGGTTTFTVTYAPDIAGAFSFDLDIISDDADEANYDIAVSGTATGEPEIEVSSSVQGGNVTVGLLEPLGSIPTGTTQTITYTVTNSGTDTLILSGISLYVPSLNNATASFNPPTVLSVPPLGGTSTINAYYTPVSAGSFSVGYTIESNDSNESSFVIGGSGTAITAPELDIRNGVNTTDIIDGETFFDVTTLKGTDFGTVDRGSTATSTFRAENNGNTFLTFGSDALSIDDTTNFTITSDLPNSGNLASSGAATFAIQFNPTTTGLKLAFVTVRSDDSDEDPYTFLITGVGVDTTAPRIASIERNTPTSETTDADSLIWRVTFDEDVTGVDTSDFTIAGTTATVTGVNAVSATVYDVTVSGGDLAGLIATVTLSAVASGGDIEDIAGNDFANTSPTGTNNNIFIVDNTIPSTTVTVTSTEGGDVGDGGTDDQGNQQIGTPKTVTYSFTNQGSTPVTINGQAPTITGSNNAGTPTVGNYTTPGTSSFTKKASLSFGEQSKIITKTVIDTISSAIVTPAYATSVSSITLLPGETTTFDVTYTPTSTGAFSIDFDIDSTIGTFDVAVSGVAIDTVAPSVAINGAPESHDNATSFNVTFEFSEDVTGFVIGDITVANGSVSNFIAVDGNTYTADIMPSGTLNVTIDVAASVAIDSASNGNTAATQVTVKGSIVSDTQRAIADFMINRANNILSNQPDMIGFINDSNNSGGGPLGNLQLESDLDSETTMSFYTSRSKVLAARSATNVKGDRLVVAEQELPLFATADRFGAIGDETSKDNSALNVAEPSDEEKLAAQSYSSNDRTGTWDVWTQIYGSKATQTNTKSEFWSANFGTHYFVSNDILIGVLTQFDWAEETSFATNSNVSGNGFLVGPYIAGKLKDHPLFYEARALWGQSDNDISPIGTYTDSFETERWLASLKVQGSYDLNDEITLKPEVSLSYFKETQEAYTDTNSNLIPEQTISLGEFKFGPTITRSFDAGNGFTMRTSIGVSGITNFAVNNANTSTSNSFANENLRARVDAGLELENEYGIRFTATGFYDGIGASGFDSYGGTLGLVIPLQ